MTSKHLFIYFSIFLSALLSISCENEPIEGDFFANPDGSDRDNPNQPTLFAEVNGVDFLVVDNDTEADFSQNIFTISGEVPETGQRISMSAQGVTGPGTYALDTQEADTFGSYRGMQGEDPFITTAPGGSGFLTITELNVTELKTAGTFEFIGANIIDGRIVDILEGEFRNVVMTTSGSDTGNPPHTDTFAATVDGSSYSVTSVDGQLLTSGGANVIAITANSATTTESVVLTLPSDVMAGSYDFDDTTYRGEYNTFAAGAAILLNAEGTGIVIASHDLPNKIITGTFQGSFTDMAATETRAFTAGSFSISY